jgi:hypothetical protein
MSTSNKETGDTGLRQAASHAGSKKYHTGVEKGSTQPAQDVSHGGSRRYHREEEKRSTGLGSRKYHTDVAENSTHERQYLNTVKDSIEKQQPSSEVTAENHSNVVVVLANLGITKKIAHELAARYPESLIRAQIDMLPYRQADDPPAVLVKAIREEWAPPAGCQTPERREAEAAVEKAREAELGTWRQDQEVSKETGDEGKVRPRREAVEFRPFQGVALDSRRVWATAVLDLKSHDGADAYLRGTRLLAREGDELVVGAGTAYAAEWLQRRVAHQVAQLLSALGGERVAVRFVAEAAWASRS